MAVAKFHEDDGGGDVPGQPPGVPERKGISGLGAGSIAIALLMGLAICGIMGLEIYLIAEHRRAKRNVQTTEIVVGSIAMLGIFLGAALGAGGLIQKTRSRVAPVAGCVLNALVAGIAVGTLVMSLTMRKH